MTTLSVIMNTPLASFSFPIQQIIAVRYFEAKSTKKKRQRFIITSSEVCPFWIDYDIVTYTKMSLHKEVLLSHLSAIGHII